MRGAALKWSELDIPWQACFEEAWGAYCSGSLPIGAAIANSSGQILVKGRNRIYGDHPLAGQVNQHILAHAELNALLQLDTFKVDPHTLTLYTSLEPCPLCMGAIYMSGIRTLHFAARDAFAGSTNLLGTTPYLARKNVRAIGPEPAELERLFLGIHVAAEFRVRKETGWPLLEVVVGTWQKTTPDCVAFGKYLDEHQLLSQWSSQGWNAEWVFDALCDLAIKNKN